MSRSKINVIVKDMNTGERIGSITAKQFMDWAANNGARRNEFLPALIEKFNAVKASMGEPERVQIEVAA